MKKEGVREICRLEELCEKLFYKVKEPIVAINFTTTRNKNEVYTIRTTFDQHEKKFYEKEEVDLTLVKILNKAPGTRSGTSSVASIIYSTQRAVLISDLLGASYLENPNFIKKIYPTYFKEQAKGKNIIYGYMGLYPYTITIDNNRNFHLSIFREVKDFQELDPFANEIRKENLMIKI